MKTFLILLLCACSFTLSKSAAGQASPLTQIITDFNGYWPSTTSSPNSVVPNNSHNLLAFTYSGITYSTGANDAILASKNVTFTAGNFRALPVAGILGINSGSSSTYLALAKKVDGSATAANITNIQNYSIKKVLTDGTNGLDLGTGVTNLPASAILTFSVFNINPLKVADDEPDIIITQIAQPVSGNDIFTFIDASGNVVGTSVSQDMTQLSKFGTYDLDLFNLTPNISWNNALAYSVSQSNTNREIRVVGFKLSDFGITTGNVSQVKSLKITPSGNSDYAFIAYNENAINIPPNISQNIPASNSSLCSGGIANLSVIGTSASGGLLSYTWQRSTDNGATWMPVNDGGIYSGAATNRLSITAPANADQYRSVVTESGNPNTSTSTAFVISINAPTAPSSVSISGPTTSCLNDAISFSSSVSGGSNLFYQWQTNANGNFSDINGANYNSYTPPVNSTGSASYRLKVASGSGCSGEVLSGTLTLNVTGIATVSAAAACGSGAVNLQATATSGNVSWYTVDAGGSAISTGNSYTTPILNNTTTYYVASSGCPSALRVPVVATVDPLSIGGSINGSTTVTTGVNNTVPQLANSTGNVLKWQSSTDNFSANVNNIANTTTTLQVVNLSATSQFRAFVQSGTCSSAMSAPATITVQSAATLPVHFISVRAYHMEDGIIVQWVVDEKDVSHYEIERSEDGKIFKIIHAVLSKENSGTNANYQWTDNGPSAADKYYRIKSIDADGKTRYSAIVKVIVPGRVNGLSLYPNPLKGGTVTLQLKNRDAGIYRVRILSSMGQPVSSFIITHTVSSMAYTLTSGNLVRGTYHIEVSSPDGAKNILKMVVMN